MPAPKPLSRDQIVYAHDKTLSNMSAARFLHVSYPTYKKWAKFYKDEKTGKSLFDLHKNQVGKGIPKFLTNGRNRKNEPNLMDVIDGKIAPSHFKPEKIKYRLIEEGYLLEECNHCGFKERRVLDYKSPLLLHFKDNNKTNYSLNNIELLCYNCYFLKVDDIFNIKDVDKIESAQVKNNPSKKTNWDVDEYHIKRLKEMGLDMGENEDEEIHKYISKL